MRWPRVMCISDGGGAGDRALVRMAALAAAARLPLALQLREKSLPAGHLLEAARRLVEAAGAGPTPVVVNGRLDVALAAGAAGVHLPASGLPPGRVRAAAGQALQVGVSTHAEEEVRRAAGDGADYVVFGPVFATPSKAGMGAPKGLDGLARAVAVAGGVPVLAVGGITPARAAACHAAGAWGVAVIRALLDAPDPEEALRRLSGEPG